MKKAIYAAAVCTLILLAVTTLVNLTFIKRTLTVPIMELSLRVDWFSPTVTVDASPDGGIPLVLAEQQLGFEDADRYAESTGSTALLVWKNGQLLHEQYFNGADRQTTTQSQSMHKSLVALLVGKAIEEGFIASIDDPADMYLEHWIEQPFGQITLRHLLTMSSGLTSEQVSGFKPFSVTNRLFNGADISKVARSIPQVRAPGEVFEYHNANVQLLVAVIEAATGYSYEDYFEEKLWSKIAEFPAKLWMDRDQGTPHGYCCLIATAADWLRVGVLFLQQGVHNGDQVQDAGWLREITSPSELNPSYGMQIWRGTPYAKTRLYKPGAVYGTLHSEPYVVPDVYFFDGYGGQRVYIIPSQQLVVVRVGAIDGAWDDAKLPNSVLAAIRIEESKKQIKDCSDCPVMNWIPPGEGFFGADDREHESFDVLERFAVREIPKRKISFDQGFYVSKYEVTRGQFEHFVAETQYVMEAGCWKFIGDAWEYDEGLAWHNIDEKPSEDLPVRCISFHDASAYAQWLAEKTGKNYRLLSNEAWQFAARGSSSSATFWNGAKTELCTFANVGDAKTKQVFQWHNIKEPRFHWTGEDCNDGYPEVAPVGSFPPNLFGLQDMIGNVNEWITDCAPAKDNLCEKNILKGHAWTGNAMTNRVAFNVYLEPTDRRFHLGIRVAVMPD